MADTLFDAHDAAQTARAAGIRCGDHGALAKGSSDNAGVRSGLVRDAPTLVHRFRDHEEMILRFARDLTVAFTNNQAERDARPVKVQQRTSGGCWRTLQGLADFAVVQSYLSTASKWGLDKLDALRQLFTTGLWPPPALEPG